MEFYMDLLLGKQIKIKKAKIEESSKSINSSDLLLLGQE